MAKPTQAETEVLVEQERRRGEYLVNFSAEKVHQNPAWEDCNMDSVPDAEKGVRSAEQLAEYKEAGYALCKKCLPKQVWPRAT